MIPKRVEAFEQKRDIRMRPSAIGVRLISISAAAAILGSCSGESRLQLAPAASSQQNTVRSRLSGAATEGLVVGHPDRGRSWMAPDAATHALLYVSDYSYNEVFVYSYPQAKLVGTLTGLSNPDGICTDKSGNVWIVNNSAGNAVEYKHGGTTPIATLNIGSANAVSCSVDPTTGNLAATVLDTYGSGQGYVAIFTHAKGSPKYYMDSEMYAVYFCGYDDKGNLFVDGDQNGRSTAFQFAELPRGKKTFTNITLKGATINFPGNVQWDGKHVAVGDQLYQDYPELGAIYQTTGAGGKIIGKTVLNDYGDIEGFWVEGKTVIGPDFCINGCTQGSSVGFFKYPAGGKPTKTFAGGFKSYSQPAGAAVSQ